MPNRLLTHNQKISSNADLKIMTCTSAGKLSCKIQVPALIFLPEDNIVNSYIGLFKVNKNHFMTCSTIDVSSSTDNTLITQRAFRQIC